MHSPTLAIITVATQSYQYLLQQQAVAIQQNINLAGFSNGHIILVTDENPVAGILAQYRALLGDGWQVHHIPLPVVEGAAKDYGVSAQLLIAQLYTAGFCKARALGVDYVWTLESDVLPEANNLRCMRDMLAFDAGYYDVAFCPYVSAGGGGIMGGRGSSRNWIFPNWTLEETDLPPELEAQIKEHKAKQENTQQWADTMQQLEEQAKKHPPKGNVFKLNGEEWKRRGWLEAAYPGIGKGAVLPSDWLPMGNNLFSAKALNYCDFTGYTGKGTQDLYLAFMRLATHGLKFCVIPHSPSQHVLKKNGELVMYYLYHEEYGECVGHLRQKDIKLPA